MTAGWHTQDEPASLASGGSAARLRGFAWAAIAATLLKIFIAFYTIGTNDSLTWEHDLTELRTGSVAQLYRDGVQYSSPAGRVYPAQEFVHPPAMVSGLRALGALQDDTGLPLRFWMRLTCAFADLGTLMIVWMQFRATRDANLFTLMALCPISILVSGFHTNTDPIMIFFLIASVFLIERRNLTWAGIAFGLAASVKLVPIIFAPAILLAVPSFRDRVRWICIAAVTWIALSMPYLAENPILILKKIFGYGSATGLWGFYMLSGMLHGTALGFLNQAYPPAAKWIALLAVAALPVMLRILRVRLDLFAQCGMVVFAFLFLSPGFGVQYLAWTVPWLVVFGTGPMAAYYAVAGTCLLSLYTAASGGIGANAYADSFHVSMAMRIFLRLVCWVAIGAITTLYARLALRLSRGTQTP